MRGRLHHIIDTMQIFHFKNGCTLSKWPIQPELIAAFQPRSGLEYCCCPWIGQQSILGYHPPLPPRFLWQFAGTHVYSSQSSVAQRVDNAIQRISRYPADKGWQNRAALSTARRVIQRIALSTLRTTGAWAERGTIEKSIQPDITSKKTRPGLVPRPLDPENSALIVRPSQILSLLKSQRILCFRFILP